MAEYIISEEELNSMLDALGSPHIEYGEKIIRCRDCKHSKEVPFHDGSIRTQCDGVFTFIEPYPSGFCAWAERDE